MIYILFSSLFLVAFLVVLNGFLNGAKKQSIDTFLGFFLLALIGCIFSLSGWKMGVFSIVFVFVSVMIQFPFAKMLSLKLLDRNWMEKNIAPLFGIKR